MTPRSWRPRRLYVAAAVAVSLVVAGCSEAKNNGQNSLQPKGHDSKTIDNLFWPIAIIAIVVGILIIIATVYIALRFRYREGINDNPKQIHGNTRLDLGWTIVPALLLAVIAVPTVSTIFDLADQSDAGALEVTVVAKQWWWQFEYTDAKVVTADELVIPTKRDIHVSLTACDATLPGGCNVIHSFWVPELSGKRDVVPGHENTLTIEASRPGTFLGQCAEYCGLSHANMRLRVIAMSPDDFDTWVNEQQLGAVEPFVDSSNQPAGAAQQLITKFGCTNCHIFDDSSKASYGPNLTHLASRSTFASGNYKLNESNLVSWLLDAPSLIPMQSKDCRLTPGPNVTCVGMPSFTKNTPKGDPVMTRDEAQQIDEFLLAQK